MDLNSLLQAKGFDPAVVLVLRHRPHERALNRVLPWLAAENPELFNSFQRCHGPSLEAAMARLEGTGYVASFIGQEPGQATFVGLFAIGRSRPLTYAQYWRLPDHKRLRNLGMEGWRRDEGRNLTRRFDLKAIDFYSSWRGRLVISWPPPERSWWRRAHRNAMPVLAVLRDSTFGGPIPDWTDVAFSWNDLPQLPQQWRHTLAQWRGVYHIFDASDGKRYVGSASGRENLFGRWLNYAKTGHGSNRLLRKRDPRSFTFTILERVSPDMPPAEVAAIEASWKRRLQSRAPYGLNDN